MLDITAVSSARCAVFTFIKSGSFVSIRHPLTAILVLIQSLRTKRKQLAFNIDGHLGTSILAEILDVPLPNAIMIDYLHVTLLRHAKTIIQDLYSRLKPAQREQIDIRLKRQRFPHFFNRRMRPLKDLSFVKTTEIRNILFYALVPLLLEYFPVDLIAHLSLYVAGIRLLHNEPVLGEQTERIAGLLLDRYYADHEAFYTGLQNLVLHLHHHFKQHYINFGALSYTSTFAQEDLIKCELFHPPFEIILNPFAILSDVSSNKHGTRHFGDLISFYYCLDFALHSDNQVNILDGNRDGPFDLHERYESSNDVFLMRQHGSLCGCLSSLLNSFVSISLSSVSSSADVRFFFIQYQDARSTQHFGEISYFFLCRSTLWIQRSFQRRVSNIWVSRLT